MSQPAIRCTDHTRIAGWLSALVATATFAFLRTADQQLPLLVPVLFEDGNPLQFAFKTPGLVYLPVGLQLALGLIFGGVIALLMQRRVRPSAESDARSALVAQHTAEGVAWLALIWITFQAVNAWRLAALWRRTFDPDIEFYVLGLITALTATVLVCARVVVKVQEVAPSAAEFQAPVVDQRRPLATAGLAALLAVGIAAPLYLLSVVWSTLRPI